MLRNKTGRIFGFIGGCIFFLMPFVALSASNEIITSISFEGNNKTKPQVLTNELMIQEGDILETEALESSRQNIMDLGLFKSVESSVEEGEQGVAVTFKIEEKRYWYGVPVFSRGSDGDITWGVRLQLDNLAGLNNKLTLRAKRSTLKDTDIQSEDTVELEYEYPRIFGTDYDFATYLDYDTAQIEEERGEFAGNYERVKHSGGLRLSKWLTTNGPSKGLRLTLGLRTEIYDHTYLSGDEGLFTDITINSLYSVLEHIDVIDFDTYRNGEHYGLELISSSSAVGSDIPLTSYNLFYRKYLLLNESKKTNLNLQARIGTTTRSIFGDATYQITGGTAVRGYARDSIEGDAFYIFNAEYLRPIAGKETLRGAAFVDVGDAFNTADDFDFSDPKAGVGLGLRWTIRSFVRTSIRLDVAHGLNDNGETKIYAGTRATF